MNQIQQAPTSITYLIFFRIFRSNPIKSMPFQIFKTVSRGLSGCTFSRRTQTGLKVNTAHFRVLYARMDNTALRRSQTASN